MVLMRLLAPALIYNAMRLRLSSAPLLTRRAIGARIDFWMFVHIMIRSRPFKIEPGSILNGRERIMMCTNIQKSIRAPIARRVSKGALLKRRRKKAHQNHTIDRWPKLERPREKLATNGASTLSDAELLAIFLRVGVEGQSAVDLARALISRFGSVRALLSAPSDE